MTTDHRQATLQDVDGDTLRVIQQTAVQASGADGKLAVIHLANQPAGTATLVTPDGELLEHELPRPWRQHELRTVGQVQAWLEHWRQIDALDSGDDAEDSQLVQPSVWYCETGLQIVLDDRVDSQRRDRLSCPLRYSAAFEFLQRQAEAAPMSQKQFTAVLRTVLWDCLQDAPQLLKMIRTLRRTGASTHTAHDGHGRSNYGADIDQAVVSEAGDLPEELTLQVRVFRDAALETRQPIRCALIVETDTMQFQLLPLAGQLDDAVAEEMQTIHKLLESCGAPAFYGTPDGGKAGG